VPYVTLETFHPLLVTRRVGLAEPADVGAMLRWVDRHLVRAEGKIAFVYDAGTDPNGRPDAKARRMGGEWFAARRDLLQRACAGIDFAFPSPLSRGALTAVFWITAPPIPCGLHASLDAAVTQAIGRLGLDLAAARVLEALAAATPRTD
jgi:hypothetical protein